MCLRMLDCGKQGWQKGGRFLKKKDLFLQSVLEQLKSFSLSLHPAVSLFLFSLSLPASCCVSLFILSLSPCILLCLSFWFFVCLCFESELLNLTGNKRYPSP